MSPTGCPPGAFPPYGPVMNDTALTVHQTARPHGFPTAEHFAFVESTLPEPAAGSALVANLYWSVDPYHREMMDDVPFRTVYLHGLIRVGREKMSKVKGNVLNPLELIDTIRGILAHS